MKITVTCQKCGRILSIAQKDDVSQEDLDMYVNNSVCQYDGPFPPVMGQDDNGDPVELEPAVTNTIVAIRTLE